MAKKEAQPTQTPRAKAKRLLAKRIDLPVKGRLGKEATTPQWLKAFGGYFVGAWQELRAVSWPTRRATWSLTLAVILFVFILAAFIFGIDAGFEQLFKGVFIK